MITPDAIVQSPLVTPWVDPQSGVTSYLLASVAPLQQSFYFVNQSFSADGRYLWFYCAFPPGGKANYGRMLGVADFETGEIRHFPETQFLDASPMVDAATGEAYWASGESIWKRGPQPEAACVLVNELPKSLTNGRTPWRIATHLTKSADGRGLGLDVTLGRETHVGYAPLNGGPIEIWQTLHAGFNHAQFSPTDPDLLLLCQDSYVDVVTGEIPQFDNRLWLIRRGGKAAPIYQPIDGGSAKVLAHSTHQDAPPRMVDDGPKMHGHEWWAADGRRVYFVHYGQGVKSVELPANGELRETLIWAWRPVSHAHCNAAGTLFVGDAQPPAQRVYSKVIFFNAATGREIEIASHMPHPDPLIKRYHVHPHPQFCLGDQFICYTTNVRGQIDVALARVEELVARTGDSD